MSERAMDVYRDQAGQDYIVKGGSLLAVDLRKVGPAAPEGLKRIGWITAHITPDSDTHEPPEDG